MNLFLPSDPRPLHFVGIGGAGMSALALIALRRGLAVSGSDTDITGASDLSAAGATMFSGHAAAHIGNARAVVVSAAIPAGHGCGFQHPGQTDLVAVMAGESGGQLIGNALF